MRAGKLEIAGQRGLPNVLLMQVPGLSLQKTNVLALYAEVTARRLCPKVSGRAASRIHGIAEEGFFGLHWFDSYLWYQEAGTRPFTMHKLAGKVIPMWVEDHDGKLRRENPQIKTRATKDGRTQVLIFRRAARHGERKTVHRMRGGRYVDVNVPASYPGTPGRIAAREAAAPHTREGRVGGRIAPGNVGVRWRHPGIMQRGFLHEAMRRAAVAHGLPLASIVVAEAA